MNKKNKMEMENGKWKMENEHNSQFSTFNSQLNTNSQFSTFNSQLNTNSQFSTFNSQLNTNSQFSTFNSQLNKVEWKTLGGSWRSSYVQANFKTPNY